MAPRVDGPGYRMFLRDLELTYLGRASIPQEKIKLASAFAYLIELLGPVAPPPRRRTSSDSVLSYEDVVNAIRADHRRRAMSG